jgi:hypothetical protein
MNINKRKQANSSALMANIRRAIRTALITHLLPFLVLPLIIGIVNGRGHARKNPVIERP